MLAGDFKAKQEYKDAQMAVAVLLAADREERLTIKHYNESSAILAPFLSQELHGYLVMR